MPLANIGIRRTGVYTSTPCESGPEAASQNYVRGAPLVYDANGRIQEGGTDPTGILGFAQHDGNNGAAGAATAHWTSTAVSPEFIGSVDDGSSEGTGTSALTQVGARYGLTRTSQTGNEARRWYVDTNKTAINLQRVEVTELIDAAGTTEGRVAFRLL